MIKIDNINVIVDGSEYSAKVEIPSQITTSTPQEETVDLAKTPNLFIKVVDPDNTLKIGVNVEVQLITEEGTYTMICDVVSKNQMYTTLQYAYGMTFEADDSSDDEQTNPQSLSEVRHLENNAEFTFDGTVTVINKSSNNRELYVQDTAGSAGIKMYQSNIGSSFSTGDVIYNGWTATKSVYNGVTQLASISNLNYSGDTTTLIANELSIPSFTESDTYNYYLFRNITINGNAIEDGEGNTMAIYNQFSTTIPSDAQHYDAYGVVAWYNNATSFYPMSFELVGGDDGSSDDPETEKPAMEISSPQGSPFSMEYNPGDGMPAMYDPITVDEMTLGVSDDNGYTTVVDAVGVMGLSLPSKAFEYLTPTSISGNDHCSLSWVNSPAGFDVTSSDTSQWSDDITVEFELNDSNSSCTILGDEWSGNYSSFEEYVATLPESIQPYVTNNAENRPEIPLSVWNGCTATIVFTVDYAGGT